MNTCTSNSFHQLRHIPNVAHQHNILDTRSTASSLNTQHLIKWISNEIKKEYLLYKRIQFKLSNSDILFRLSRNHHLAKKRTTFFSTLYLKFLQLLKQSNDTIIKKQSTKRYLQDARSTLFYNSLRHRGFGTLPSWIQDPAFERHMQLKREAAIKLHEETNPMNPIHKPLFLNSTLLSKTHLMKFLTPFNLTQSSLLHPTANPSNDTSPSITPDSSLTDSGDTLLETEIHTLLHSKETESTNTIPAISRLKKTMSTVIPRFNKSRPIDTRFFKTIGNIIQWNTTWVDWDYDRRIYQTRLHAGRNTWFFGGLSQRDRSFTRFSAGWKNGIVSGFKSEFNKEAAFRFSMNPFGIFIDHSHLQKATLLELRTRRFETATLADFIDRDFGQRIRLRNFEIGLRHDYDEYEFPDPLEFATEFVVAYKRTGLAIGTDISGKQYGVSLNIRNYQVSVFNDFQNRIQAIFGSTKNGFQFSINGNLQDEFDKQIFGQVGIGKPNGLHIGVGGGISNEGIPEGIIDFILPDVKVFVSFLGNREDPTFRTAIQIGKFKYIWKSVVSPDQLRLPNVFGLSPNKIKSFLTNIQNQNILK